MNDKVFDICSEAQAEKAARLVPREDAVRAVALDYGFNPHSDGSMFYRTCPNCRTRLCIYKYGGVEGIGCGATQKIIAEIREALEGLPR